MLGGIHPFLSCLRPTCLPCSPLPPADLLSLLLLCSPQAPDGTLLCTCSEKKVQWYLERELADLVAEEPITARLKFEPRGRDNEDYYLVCDGV